MSKYQTVEIPSSTKISIEFVVENEREDKIFEIIHNETGKTGVQTYSKHGGKGARAQTVVGHSQACGFESVGRQEMVQQHHEFYCPSDAPFGHDTAQHHGRHRSHFDEIVVKSYRTRCQRQRPKTRRLILKLI